ncbi:G2/mitotic-specific cyclin-B [Drosophila novamexicana]|uniref:G2/mitotic-specific cyclin-B n=1 Tax=Drosophila novamexicana TaxID=47314 RepID=UPI0011E5F1D6|nr:G2/mitotic-specific cyclin-B [Drosophila novamexicana]
MVSTALKMIMDENATEKYNNVQVKKLTVPSNEANHTKRAALGDLQNRGLNRGVISKDAAQKELKDVKLTKARVDTHWKKQPLGVSNANANAGAAKATAASLMRSNSMRTHGQQPAAGASQISASTLNAGRTAATTTANAKVAADANNKLAAAAKQKSISDEKVNTLRREDSNLSRKSLTKLRAALAKPNVPAAAAVNAQKKEPLVTRAQTRTAANALAVKKDVTAAAVHLKKEPTALARLPKMRPTPVVAAAIVPSTLSLAGKRLAEVEDIDADDRENLVLVSEYVNDIYDYLYELEEQQPIQTDHLANQLEVSHKMRAVLIDWINEVHLQFHLAAETFHLAVAIIDRYLQVVKNTRRKYLQLVGVTALFIATKYEELFPPAIGDFVFITDDSYTGREIRQMELQILKAIDNNLSRPLPIHFLRRYSKAASAEDEHHAMSKYFLELAAMDYELASYKPSEIAAGSLFLSLHLLNGNARAATGFNDKHWTPTLVHYSRYTAAHLRPITRQIAKLARDAPTTKLRAIYNKYQANKFQKIALRAELSGPLMDSIVGKK